MLDNPATPPRLRPGELSILSTNLKSCLQFYMDATISATAAVHRLLYVLQRSRLKDHPPRLRSREINFVGYLLFERLLYPLQKSINVT